MFRPWTRRELLTAFLGAPLAAACVRRQPDRALPPGDLVGPSVDVGHRLRDGLRLEVPADAWRDVEVVIVGGGIAGLATAWRLGAAAFADFVLLDLPTPGSGPLAVPEPTPLLTLAAGLAALALLRRNTATL